MSAEKREPTTKSVTPKQLKANRENAKRSSGPRSEAGRRRSSRNATTHGAWASTIFPVPSGLYAENSFDLELFVRGIIDGLAPRDAIEAEEAKQVALAYLRLDRLAHLESDLAAADGTLSRGEILRLDDPDAYLQQRLGKAETPKRGWIGNHDNVTALLRTAQEMVDVLREPNYDRLPVWELLARLIRTRGGNDQTSVPDLWDEHHTPDTPDEWKRTFYSLLRRHWATDEEAVTWALQFIEQEVPRLGQLAGRALASVASRTLENSFGRATQLRARVNRELVVHLGLYGQLQDRLIDNHDDDPYDDDPYDDDPYDDDHDLEEGGRDQDDRDGPGREEGGRDHDDGDGPRPQEGEADTPALMEQDRSTM
jgi:hypothetical protein